MDYTIRDAIVPGCFNRNEQGYGSIDVQIVDGRIAAIGSSLEVKGTAIDGTNKLLLPGFVNAHTHSSEMWQRGSIPPRPLELWLAELYDFTPLDPHHIYLSALHTAAETLMTGGTCVVDHLVLIPHRELETIAAAVRAYRDIGIRAYVAPLIQDQSISTGIPEGGAEREHEAFPRTTEEVLAWLTDAIEQFHRPHEGISLMAAPSGMHLASNALLMGCVELSDRYDLCRHTHLLETKAQKLIAQEKYGYSAVEHLKRLGFLGDRTSLAHCVWLDDAEIEILAATRSTVVHNPLSNLRLGSGIAPILKYRRAGVNVTFGCDGAASNDSQDLLEAIKIGSILHNVTDLDYREWITPQEAIEMAAIGGAKGLGMQDEFGSLTVGKQADLVLYDLTDLSLLPRTDPIGLLILGRPTQVVHSAWVAGRQIIADGQITSIDLQHLKQELFRLSNWHTTRSSPQAIAAESHYRSVMGLND